MRRSAFGAAKVAFCLLFFFSSASAQNPAPQRILQVPDVEWSGAVAPAASIKFVTSASTNTTAGIDLSALYIIENNVAPVMSERYGECEMALRLVTSF
ncbi:MAG TPA: hypothetical protein VG322_15205 [Candidatus Acidoferrales bacterium]|jgi:hypothetical protein|nr:hypothetical protein [Candidatus Acidoferrales bacterium]